VLAYWKFESISLQRGVSCEPDFSFPAELGVGAVEAALELTENHVSKNLLVMEAILTLGKPRNPKCLSSRLLRRDHHPLYRRVRRSSPDQGKSLG
jgi:hypothetical protein